ncbi:MAG: outer membrane beta-barrel protein [Planctomycetes bacterium]|nr:outer membrane beta-barrel protein [Planctomycetota bacterium]
MTRPLVVVAVFACLTPVVAEEPETGPAGGAGGAAQPAEAAPERPDRTAEVEVVSDTPAWRRSGELFRSMELAGTADLRAFVSNETAPVTPIDGPSELAGPLTSTRSTFELARLEGRLRGRLSEAARVHADVWVGDTDRTGNGQNAVLEEGHIEARAASLWDALPEGMRLRAGKWAAPMGYESPDPLDNWFATQSSVSFYTTPTYFTGAMLRQVLSSWADLDAYLVNGWDANHDANAGKTLGARLGVDTGRQATLNGHLLYGDERAGKSALGRRPGERLLLSADLTARPGDRATLGAEHTYVLEEDGANVGGGDATWTGTQVLGRWDLTPRHYLAARGGLLQDHDAVPTGLNHRLRELTLGVGWLAAAGVECRLEARSDTTNRNFFDARRADDRLQAAAELLVTF